MEVQQYSNDSIRLRFISFTLKDNTKKWLHRMPTNTISMWDEFVKAFLKKFYLIYKTITIKNVINQF